MNLLAVRADGSTAASAFAEVMGALPSGASRFGVRPEDVYLARADGTVLAADPPATATDPVECTVSVVEPIGRAYELTLRTGGREFIARRRAVPDELDEEDAVHAVFDREKLYTFDESGERIA
jgi:multiple sugar transport system ATP-binding protein